MMDPVWYMAKDTPWRFLATHAPGLYWALVVYELDRKLRPLL